MFTYHRGNTYIQHACLIHVCHDGLRDYQNHHLYRNNIKYNVNSTYRDINGNMTRIYDNGYSLHLGGYTLEDKIVFQSNHFPTQLTKTLRTF